MCSCTIERRDLSNSAFGRLQQVYLKPKRDDFYENKLKFLGVEASGIVERRFRVATLDVEGVCCASLLAPLSNSVGRRLQNFYKTLSQMKSAYLLPAPPPPRQG